jgi:NADPH:quinone reductase
LSPAKDRVPASRLEEESMKAIVFTEVGGPEVLKLADVPTPEMRPGMVLIKNHAIGVNFADTLFRQGTYAVAPKFPDSPGLEASGVVEAVGEGVTGLPLGTRVAAIASKTYAEFCLAPATQVIPLPKSVSFAEGAAFPIQVLTAYHLLHTAFSTTPGHTVLVHSAAGGVGLAAVQLAKVAGARVFATVSSDAKAGLVKENGADTIINYGTQKFADEVLRLTDGRGVDLILDAVGKPTFEEGIRCLAPFGHLILYGRSGGAPDPLNVFTLFPKSQTVSGFMLPTVTRGFPDRMRESADRCFALLRDGRLKLHIGRTFPLAQAAEAHRYLESRQSTGKLILTP